MQQQNQKNQIFLYAKLINLNFIKLIPFSQDITVDKFFLEELEEFQKSFPNVHIKTGSDSLKLKPKVKLHPIIKLRNYIDKHHLKLAEFFNKFDKDGSMNVTKDEFIMGLKVTNKILYQSN